MGLVEERGRRVEVGCRWNKSEGEKRSLWEPLRMLATSTRYITTVYRQVYKGHIPKQLGLY